MKAAAAKEEPKAEEPERPLKKVENAKINEVKVSLNKVGKKKK
jgi:hypothetical protein